MYLPHIKHTENATRQMLSVFGGYNHNTVISEGEFYEMTNMTSNLYPVLSSRPSRKGYANHAECVMWVGDKRISLQPPHVVIGDETDTMIDLGLQSGVEHKAVVSGAYLVIFPEAVFVNLMKTTEFGALSQTKDPATGILHTDILDGYMEVSCCLASGELIQITGKIKAPGGDQDVDPGTLYYYYYCETDKNVYCYDVSTKEWHEEGPCYVSVSHTISDENGLYHRNWFSHLKPNDVIAFEHMPAPVEALNAHWVVHSIDGENGSVMLGGFIDLGGELIVPIQLFSYDDGLYVQHINPLPTVSFVIPPLDFITSCENRLWGCRYGLAHNGEFVNEIYCTALGDIHRWYNLNDGENSHADNSWIASIGHMGPFTGAVSYGGRPYFFKQDRIYAVYGDTATTFGYTELTERGVQAGCEASLCVLDGVLYYKALDGIVAFDGSSTSLISQALGAVKYGDAVGGGVGGKYYVSMVERSSGLPSLFAFDARRGLWHREDGLTVSYFTNDHHGDLWGISGDTLYCFGERDNSEVIPWCVESGIIGLDDPDKKYISRLSLRLSLDVGAFVKVSIQYDSMGDFESVLYYEGVYLQTITLPIMPRRCDHMRIRMEGVGGVRIYSLTKTIEGGSDT